MTDAKLLAPLSLFAGLTDSQLEHIAASGSHHTFGEGDQIFHEGDAGEEMYVLLKGRVQITVELGHAAEQAPVHTVLPGHVFGEFAIVTGAERSATAMATESATCFVLSRETFEGLAEQDPQLAYRVTRNLAEILCGRIVKTTRELRASLMF